MTSQDNFKAVAIHGPLHGPGAHEAVCGDTKRFKHLLKHLYKSPSATDANPDVTNVKVRLALYHLYHLYSEYTDYERTTDDLRP